MKFPLIFAALGFLAFAPAANAQLTLDESGGGTHLLGSSGTSSNPFNVLNMLSVTEPDAYVGGGVQNATVPVGASNSSGALLTSVTTTPSVPGGNHVGTYTIGEFGVGSDTADIGSTIISEPEVSNGSREVTAAGLPSLSGPTNDIGAGVAIFSNAIPPPRTPEPGSVTLLIGMATVGAGVLRKRRK